MKWLVLIVGLVLSSTTSIAQKYNRVYAVANRSALDIYFLASDFALEKKLAYKRDPVNDAVYMDVLIPVAANECIKEPGLKGRLIIQAKDGKTRILLDSITYSGLNVNSKDSSIGGVNTDGPSLFINASYTPQQNGEVCAPSGALEQLNNCPVCRNDMEKINSMLDVYFDRVANDYKEYLTRDIKAGYMLQGEQ